MSGLIKPLFLRGFVGQGQVDQWIGRSEKKTLQAAQLQLLIFGLVKKQSFSSLSNKVDHQLRILSIRLSMSICRYLQSECIHEPNDDVKVSCNDGAKQTCVDPRFVRGLHFFGGFCRGTLSGVLRTIVLVQPGTGCPVHICRICWQDEPARCGQVAYVTGLN